MADKNKEKLSDAVGGWDDYEELKLTPEVVKDDKMPFICTNVQKAVYDDNTTVKVTFEHKEKEYSLNFNKTNRDLAREKGISEPKTMIGRVFFFGKRKVTNPSDGKLMDSLYIERIEEAPSK